MNQLTLSSQYSLLEQKKPGLLPLPIAGSLSRSKYIPPQSELARHLNSSWWDTSGEQWFLRIWGENQHQTEWQKQLN